MIILQLSGPSTDLIFLIFLKPTHVFAFMGQSWEGAGEGGEGVGGLLGEQASE